MSANRDKGNPHKSRYYPRMKTEVLLSYRGISSSAEETVVTRTRSLGLGGLMFESENAFEEGSRYHIDLVFGEEKMPVTARVVYSLPSGDVGYEVGFAFEELSEKEREKLTSFFIRHNTF